MQPFDVVVSIKFVRKWVVSVLCQALNIHHWTMNMLSLLTSQVYVTKSLRKYHKAQNNLNIIQPIFQNQISNNKHKVNTKKWEMAIKLAELKVFAWSPSKKMEMAHVQTEHVNKRMK